MNWSRILPLLALVALLIAPLGRATASDALAMPHHQPTMSQGHCEDMPAPAEQEPGTAAVECMIACSAIAPAAAPRLAEVARAKALRDVFVPPAYAGLDPESETPPPRIS